MIKQHRVDRRRIPGRPPAGSIYVVQKARYTRNRPAEVLCKVTDPRSTANNSIHINRKDQHEPFNTAFPGPRHPGRSRRPAQEAKVVPRKDDLASVVANERAALAKLGEMEADFAVSPTGHITAIEVGLGQHSMRLSPSPTGGFILLGPDPRRTRQRVGHELPLGAERAGKSLHFQSAANAHAMDWLPKLKRLTRIDVGYNVGDKHLAIIAKIPSLRELSFGATNISAKGMAELANLRNLERLTVSGTKVTPRSHKPGQPAKDDPEDDLSTDPTDPGPGITDAAIAPISPRKFDLP